MTDETPPAAAPAPSQESRATVTDVQAREAIAAAAEVLNGAGPARILELAEKIALAKVLFREIAAGNLGLAGRPTATR